MTVSLLLAEMPGFAALSFGSAAFFFRVNHGQ
jgi:hypothetical protein